MQTSDGHAATAHTSPQHTRHSPLQRIARLKPSASAVPEFMFSTTRCFTFFRTTTTRVAKLTVTGQFTDKPTHSQSSRRQVNSPKRLI